MINRKIFLYAVIFLFVPQLCLAESPWEFRLLHETPKLVSGSLFLNTTADLNKNGKKEIIVANFGRDAPFEDFTEIEYFKHYSTLLVLEYEKDALVIKWNKRWDTAKLDTRASRSYFLAHEARRMMSWEIGGRVVVETIPPYLNLEWIKGKYVLKEQQGPFNKGPLVGSWVFPWLDASCHQGFFNKPSKFKYPRECMVAIRDFKGNAKPKILTIYEKKLGRRKYLKTLRVRKYEPGFQVEWEMKNMERISAFASPKDRFNYKSSSGIMFWGATQPRQWYLFYYDDKDNAYRLKKSFDVNTEKRSYKISNIYELSDYYLRRVHRKDQEEFWGYWWKDVEYKGDKLSASMLGWVRLKPDLTGFGEGYIDFERHKDFVGVRFFVVEDIDNDGLDEIILVESTAGDRYEGEDSVRYTDIKDYIHILKWDGKHYKTMWVSPPYTKNGTRFLVEDIKGNGEKQLIVLTSHGTIQVWERK